MLVLVKESADETGKVPRSHRINNARNEATIYREIARNLFIC